MTDRYIKPEMEVLTFKSADIVTSSVPVTDPDETEIIPSGWGF